MRTMLSKYSLFCSAFFLVSGLFGEDLILNNESITLSGTYSYDNVSLINSTINVSDSLILNISGTLNIDASSAIRADGVGDNPSGIGGSTIHAGGGGGGYGGNGGTGYGGTDAGSGGSSFGSTENPEMGSKGGSGDSGYAGKYGGGLIKIISPHSTILGTISANGDNSEQTYGGAGSGGGISIISDSLTLSGGIEAKGGDGTSGGGYPGGGGGGGRINIKTDSPHNFSGNIDVTGGAEGNGGDSEPGQDGQYLLEASPFPNIQFIATPQSGQPPLVVQFTDQSQAIEGSIVSWAWNFGDGNISTVQNPTHTYTTQGLFTVSLTVTDNNSFSITETKQGYINTYTGPVYYVSTSGSDSEGNGSEEYPFSTIQHGIDVSSYGDTVLVQAGTYVENINYNGKNIVVQGVDKTTTIIDGGQNGSVVMFNNNEQSTAVLNGFTLINGSGYEQYAGYKYGGGIFCNESNPTLTNLIITENSTNDRGGGIYCHSSNPIIANVAISNNIATEYDHAAGGGIYLHSHSSPILTNVLIANNTANISSGGLVCDIYCDPILTNVTIVNNISSEEGSEIFMELDSDVTLINSIIWSESPHEVVMKYSSDRPCTITISYSDIKNGIEGIDENNGTVTWGSGNIDADPLFVDESNGDFHLQWGSPAIDAGNPESPLDPDGTRADMGAYYYPHSPVLADFTATPTSGQVPLDVQFTDQSVDMGLSIVGWSWDFGDENTSTDQNPSHTYETYGVYDVSLTVTDNNGNTSTETKEDYITANYSGPAWYVSNDGDDSGQGTIDDPFATFYQAQYVADNGDSILFYEGNYGEITVSKSIFISSAHFQNLTPEIIDQTIFQQVYISNGNEGQISLNGISINGDSQSHGVNIADADSLSITNSYLKNHEYGILIYDESVISIDNCTLSNNSYYVIQNQADSDVSVNNSIITENSGNSIFVSGTSSNSFDLIISNSEIYDNQCKILSVDVGYFEMQNVQIYDNTSVGSNLFSFHPNFNTNNKIINNVDIYDNYDNYAVFSYLINCTITNTTISNNIGYGFLSLTNSTIENSSIHHNSRTGIYYMISGALSNVNIFNNGNIFDDNSTGGGISIGQGTSTITLNNVNIFHNFAKKGGGIYIHGGSGEIIFSETEKCNIYENYATSGGTDIWNEDQSDQIVVLDTFTVATPTDYYAHPIGNITFDIENNSVDPIVGDIYVDPTGSNDNSGNSPGSPYKTISYAMLSAFANSSNPGTIHLADGIYSPSTNGEYFPLGGKDYVSISGTSQIGTILNGDSISSIFYFEDIEDVTISDLTVTNGYANDGGGIYISNSNPIINNILIDDNTAEYTAGGIYFNNSEIDLHNSTIYGNVLTSSGSSVGGGGIYIENCTGQIVESEIINNSNINQGGGGIGLINSTIIIEKTKVLTNYGGWSGGGISSYNANINIRNTLINNNVSRFHGSGIWLMDGSKCVITNTSIVDNYSEETDKNQLGTNYDNHFLLINSVVYDLNGESEILINRVSDTLTVSNSNITNGQSSIIIEENGVLNWLDGNIDVDPIFVDPDNGDYHLQDYSLLIGAGIDSVDIDGTWYYAPDTDIEGNPRPNPEGSSPDIGAYENQYGEPQHNPIIYVSTDGDDEGSVGFESEPFATIQAAIDYSWDGDSVLVQEGTYLENINFIGKNIAVIGQNRETTIIDGNQSGSVVAFVNGESELAIISGFTIQNGAILENGVGPTDHGTGIYIRQGSSPKILNNIIQYNYAVPNSNVDYSGGGISVGWNNGGSPEIAYNIIRNNQAFPSGGGIFLFDVGDSTFVYNNLIINNSIGIPDGITGYENHGGGVRIDQGKLYNNTIWNNYSQGVPNDVLQNGGDVRNTIIEYGSVNQGEYSYCISPFFLSGPNNINSNPLFINENNNNYLLQWGSPAIDSGDPDLDDDGEDYTTDTDDQDSDGTRMDMGAYYFDQSDPTPPTVSITSLSSNNVGTANNLIINWEANDNWVLDSAFVDMLYETQTIRIDTTLAEVGQSTIAVPDSTIDPFQLIISVWDYLHNEAMDTSETVTVFDNSPPVVDVLSPGEGFNVPEYEELTVTWVATDNIGLDSVQVYYSNDGGLSFTLMASESGDLSAYTFGIPFGISDSAQVKLLAVDLAGNETEGFSAFFSVTDNTPPTVNLTAPATESIVGIGDLMTITWNDSDNVAVETVSLFYNTDGDWTTIAENASNEKEYSWIVPNEPTDNLRIRLIGYDAVGLSDTSKVDNIKVQISYPTIVSASPVSGLIDWGVREFEFTLSQPLDESTVTTDNIQITSSYSSSLTPTIAYVDASSTIEIVYETSLAALDSITITLSDQITNVYGYALDGDNDGTGGDSYTVQYNTPMVGDYNNDFQINVDDLAQFMIGLENDSTAYELGPFSGEIPHVFVSLDQKFDVEDVMAFVMMWNWYVTNNTLAFTSYEDEGLPITIEAEHDSIYLDIPQDLSAYQVQIQYTPGSFFIGSSDDKDELFLTHEEKELGVYTIMAQPGQDKLAIPIEIRGRDANITISYKGITSQGEVAGKMTTSLTIENIPDEFVLYSNYPNPFNPTTKIDYGLPEVSNVKLIIYDILGREVNTLVNEFQDAGYKSITWHGTDAFGKNVGAGMYFYLIQAGEFRKVRKMVLLK
jgi:PKD repeat protein